MLKALLQFTFQILKDTIFLVLFILSAISTMIMIASDFRIPSWIYISVPIVAIYIASFRIYRKRVTDIEIQHLNNSDAFFEFEKKGDLIFSYISNISCNIANFGTIAGVINSVNYRLEAINRITDEFVLKQLDIKIELTPLLHGELLQNWFSKIDRKTEVIKYPLVVVPNAPIPCFFQAKLIFGFIANEKIKESIEWLSEVVICCNYNITQNGTITTKELRIKLPVNTIKQ